MMNKRAVLIAGPTASGKSALALALAEHLGGVVINADSMQVYRELRILTARPSPADEARAPHCLYGTVGAAEPYSVARWLEDLRGILAAECRVPIIVGGTGLYFEALTQGIADIPSIPTAIRDEVRALGTVALHETLSARDPVMAARLKPGDRQRLARALEVFLATGRSLAAWQSEAAAPPLLPLGEVCAIEEVRALDALGLPADAPILKALGVAPLRALLAGAVTQADAVKDARTASRHYAKRQLTWFRNKFISWRWLETKYSKKTFEQVLSFITGIG
jgi:tRNA dimethylallyltransferase